jgi:ribonuclease HII
MKKIILVHIILSIIFIAFNLSFAQIDTTTGDSKEIRKIIKEKLMQKLETDEKTINTYLVIYSEYRKKINELNKQKEILNKYIEENSDAADISQKMDLLLDMLTKITDARKEYVDKARKVLTPQQLAKAIVFQKNLRKLMQKE